MSASSRSSKSKKRRFSDEPNFNTHILRLKKKHLPGLMLSKDTLLVINDFLSDFIQNFQYKLKVLCRIKKHKTLCVRDLECTTKLCLPPFLSSCAIDCGKLAIKTVNQPHKTHSHLLEAESEHKQLLQREPESEKDHALLLQHQCIPESEPEPEQLLQCIPESEPEPEQLIQCIPESEPEPEQLLQCIPESEPEPEPEQLLQCIPESEPEPEQLLQCILESEPEPEQLLQCILESEPEPEQLLQCIPESEPAPEQLLQSIPESEPAPEQLLQSIPESQQESRKLYDYTRKERMTRKRKLSKSIIMDFQPAIKRLKVQLMPQMRLPATSLSILSNFTTYNIEQHLKGLRKLCMHTKRKTLSVSMMEFATQLYLPKSMSQRAIQYARKSVGQVF